MLRYAVSSLALIFFLASFAVACEPDDVGFRVDDTIFAGRLVEYDVVRLASGEKVAGILTYEVDELLRGDVGGKVSLVWGGTPWGGGVPDSIHAYPTEVVGIAAQGFPKLSANFAEADDPTRLRLNGMRYLVTGGCGDRFGMPASTENVAKIRSWIDAETVQPSGPLAYLSRFDEEASVSILARSIRNKLWIGVCVGLAALLAFIAWSVSRRRRRRGAT